MFSDLTRAVHLDTTRGLTVSGAPELHWKLALTRRIVPVTIQLDLPKRLTDESFQENIDLCTTSFSMCRNCHLQGHFDLKTLLRKFSAQRQAFIKIFCSILEFKRFHKKVPGNKEEVHHFT